MWVDVLFLSSLDEKPQRSVPKAVLYLEQQINHVFLTLRVMAQELLRVMRKRHNLNYDTYKSSYLQEARKAQ